MENAKSCVVTARPAGNGTYHWTWHAAGEKQASRCHFTYFYDCIADARGQGFEVDVAAVVTQLKGRAA